MDTVAKTNVDSKLFAATFNKKRFDYVDSKISQKDRIHFLSLHFLESVLQIVDVDEHGLKKTQLNITIYQPPFYQQSDARLHISTCSRAMVGFFFFFFSCVSEEKGFMSSVRGGVEDKLRRYNVPPHPQQC